MKTLKVLLLGLVLAAVGLLGMPTGAFAADSSGLAMYRLYNPNSGEHFYTSTVGEKDTLIDSGWCYEGIGWYAPESSSTPVYRLYSGTDHHYTTDATERDSLVKAGWKYEGIGWYSDDAQTVSIYRQYNPNVEPGASANNSGSHNFTYSLNEHNSLVSQGWSGEGVAWYAVAEGKLIEGSTSIMGTTKTTAQQMAAYYKSVKGSAAYPSSVYSSKGAATIEEFCQIVYEEATAEGVRAEVVFCQAMLETGWLKFGGDVKAEQCNFAGIGAVGGGAAGATFADVRTGIRAQVQHLKAYASTEPLKNDCVDPRFGYVSRGCAPTLTGLNGKWAVPGNDYGQSIYGLISKLLQS